MCILMYFIWIFKTVDSAQMHLLNAFVSRVIDFETNQVIL